MKFKINLILAFNIFLVKIICSKGASWLITLKLSFHRKYINMYYIIVVLKGKIKKKFPDFLLFIRLNFYIFFPLKFTQVLEGEF